MAYRCPSSAMTGKISFSIDVGLSCRHVKRNHNHIQKLLIEIQIQFLYISVCVGWGGGSHLDPAEHAGIEDVHSSVDLV